MKCCRINLDPAGVSLERLEHSFSPSHFEELQLEQWWNANTEESFLPAQVKMGWKPDALCVFAVLEDADIFNPIREDHQAAFVHGDVFEMFLRPIEQEAYTELHVTPDNYKFQIRIPSREAFLLNNSPTTPPEWYITDQTFFSQVGVDAESQQWWVYAEIPFKMVVDDAIEVQNGSQWIYSFSRYDYTRGKKKPVLSSTSKHKVLSYHRQQEWDTLTFCE